MRSGGNTAPQHRQVALARVTVPPRTALWVFGSNTSNVTRGGAPPVDGFELVRERVYPGDGKTEVRVEFVGDAERVGLKAEAQESAVPVVGGAGAGNLKGREVVCGESHLAEELRLRADQTRDPRAGAVGTHRLDPHRFAEQGAGQDLSAANGRLCAHGP